MMLYSVDDLCRKFDITRQTLYNRAKKDKLLSSAMAEERQQDKNKRVFYGEKTCQRLSMLYQPLSSIDKKDCESLENKGFQNRQAQESIDNHSQTQLIDELKQQKEYLQNLLEKTNEEKQQLLEQNNNLLILLAQEQKKNAILLLEPPKKSLWGKIKQKLVKSKND